VHDEQYLRLLGRQVRAVRERRRLTLEELAGDGLSIRALQNIEAGRSNPKLLTLRRIAERLVVDVGDLLPRR